MPGPNLLDALRQHLATGEVPETLRETLGGSPSTSTVQERSEGSPHHAQHAPSPARSVARRTGAPRDRVTTSTERFSVDDLGGGLQDAVVNQTPKPKWAQPRAEAPKGPVPDGNELRHLRAGAGAAGPTDPTQAEAVVPERVTPAGEVEPPLPFTRPDCVKHKRPMVARMVGGVPTGGWECLQCTAEWKVLQGRGGISGATQHRQRKEEVTDRRLTSDAHRDADALPYQGPDFRRALQPKRLTSDDTLEADLRASLAAQGLSQEAAEELRDAVREVVAEEVEEAALREDPGAEATLGVVSAQPALTYEIPVDLEELPLFGYVEGAAGVGKTFWAKEVARRGGDAVCLAATTGIASVNLGEGTTINSLLKYFDTASLLEAYTSGFLEASLKKHRNLGLQRILLDEVSMMAGDQLTILTRAIDNVNQDKPEGVPDLGLILLGDFAQLAPVPDSDPTDPRGFKKLPVVFAFESAEWERYKENTRKLTVIRRQADADFIRALQAARRGAVGEAIAYFGPRMVPTTDMNFPGPTIVAKNDAVGKFNQLRLDAVKGPVVRFPSSRWGKVRPEWGAAPKPVHQWGVPETLVLKEGARVMILANKNIGGKDEPPVWAYTNGDLGTFLGPVEMSALTHVVGPNAGRTVEYTAARVVLDRTGTEVVVSMLNRFNEIPLEPGRRKALKEEGHPERISENGKKEYIGGITYMPLRLAYATTVHKSQGLSLDKVQVNIRDSFFAQPGMLYVALSRARSVEGLRLVGTPEGFRARCTTNPKLKGYL